MIFRNPKATIAFGKGTFLGPGFSLHMPFGGTFISGEYVEFRRNFRAELGPNGRIEIGSGSYMTYDVIITCDTSITIGERCGIGQCAYVVDGNHRYRDLDADGWQDGAEYDRTPGASMWATSDPNGAVSIADAILALNQIGDNCS